MSIEKDTTPVVAFELEQWQLDAIRKWQIEHECRVKHVGAAGGRFTWEFTPTGLGTSEKVKCFCGASIDVTDFESW